jgi:hypothetical protein
LSDTLCPTTSISHETGITSATRVVSVEAAAFTGAGNRETARSGRKRFIVHLIAKAALTTMA